MKKFKHTITGIEGEDAASKFLEKKGYTILCKRWKFKHKEIDIIAKQNETLIVVEVKTRTHANLQKPEDAVDKKKQLFLIEAAEHFIEQYTFFKEIRFDIISIIKNGNHFEIYHIENAFIPEL